jgi:flagellar motor switch protein FliG
MIAGIKEQDPETGALVMKMMVVWEDMPIIGDRALQEALRASDPRKLALAMLHADQRIADKIKMNLSETGRNMVYEESLLLNNPKPKAITEARELLLQDLRELNDAGMLEFEEQ